MARICDRCAAAAVDILSFKSTDEYFDICLSCSEKIHELIAKPDEPKPKKRGREKKDGKKS